MSKAGGKKSSSNAVPHGELPLLDEVHELIEKERLLLSLKVLEQQKEAQEWKAKYDTLVVKVGDTAARTGDFRPLELAAKTSAAETVPPSPSPAPSSSSSSPSSSSSSSSSSTTTSSSTSTSTIAPTSEAVQALITQLRHPWVLDLSRKAVRPALLAVLNADVFTVRGPSTISVARLSHCCMGDDCSAGLGTLASRLGCEALDASFNDLGPSLVAQLNAGLKTRRRTPQYVLLHGNMALSNSPVPLTSTLQMLTDSTWGFSASLADLSHGVLSGVAPGHASHKRAQDKPAGSSAASKAGAKAAAGKAPRADSSAIQDLYDSSKHPLRSLALLTDLLTIVDPEGGSAARGSKAQAKKGKDSAKEAKEAKEAGRGGVIRTSKMTMLSFLGLTHAHLSMQSVSKLGEVLRAISPSLTDLDLSFGYIGLHGARTLRTFLQAPRCQIVRLGLCGNNVGDEGCVALSEGMRGNRTLTALDLRSNNVSSAGLRSLCSALMPLGRLVGAGGVMHLVDLRGNPVPQAAAISAQSELRARGSGVLLRSGAALPAEFSLDAGAASAAASASTSGTSSAPGLVLFQHPFLTFAPLQPGTDAGPATASLHSIDLRFASAHHSQHAGHPLCLEWDMRPAGPRAPPLEWLVSVHSPTQDRVLQRQVLSGTSCLPTGGGDGNGAGATWTRCRAVLTDLPIKGSLLLRALAPEGTGGGVECSNLVLYTIAPSPLVCIGHDEAAWSSAENSAAAASSSLGGSFGCPWSARLPRGFLALRAMKAAAGSGAGMRVEWECKLATRAGQAGGLGGPSAGGSNSLGYEWMLLVAACQGASSVVAARGECFPDPTSDAALRPWLWSSLAADIPADVAVLPGDSVLLAARVKSAYEGSVVPLEDGGADGLVVHARNVRLLAPQESGTAGPSDCTGTTMMVTHNTVEDWC